MRLIFPLAHPMRRPPAETGESGFSLTELLIVLVIVGILTLLALPRFMSVTSRAKATEAKLALQQLYTLEHSYRLEHDRYSDEETAIGYEPNQLTTEGGSARYDVQIEQASTDGFTASATAVVDFDGDGTFDVWEVDESGQVRQRMPD